jgi:medium-chain acyl-[acyl-carrier-protein] hydrolase
MTLPARVAPAPRCAPVGCHRREPSARLRLVAFAHAGGGPATFQRFAPELAPELELWHVTLPGRAGRWREPFARDWPSLSGEIAAAVMREIPPPVALLGHSLGALIAFEVARGLMRAGTAPVHLIVSGRSGPEVRFAIPVPDDDGELVRSAALIYGGVPSGVLAAPDVLAHFLPILRADLALARAYELWPGPRLSCPITAIVGDADPLVPAAALAGWAAQTEAECALCELAGGHFYFLDQPAALTAKVRERLL